LSSLLWGFSYITEDGIEYVKAKEEKNYKNSRLEKDCNTLIDLKRNEVLARDVVNESGEHERASYFDVYRYLYK
jgi:hypothetical protein